MSRSRARITSADPPLFPFLAVLLCTLGVLVMLLTAMASVQMDGARQKQAAAERPLDPAEQAEQEKLRQAMQQVEEQLKRAKEVREKAKERFQFATDRLAVVEKSMREHQHRLEDLRQAIAEQEALKQEHTSDLEEAQKRLRALEARIAERTKEIEARREELAKKPTSYAILPYHGPGGTKRRPIYIECLADRVVIQPEGIVLGPTDFNATLEQGTPLTAALRAARVYYNRQSVADAEEAYPLILVRPDAIGTYLRVSSAIQHWDAAYGYEMVPADWKLDCGLPNPDLASEMQLAVENARTAALARAEKAPGRFRQGQIDSFAVPPTPFQLAEAAVLQGRTHIDINEERNRQMISQRTEQTIDSSRIAMALVRARMAAAEEANTGNGAGQGKNTWTSGEGERSGGLGLGKARGIEPGGEGKGEGTAPEGEAGGTDEGTLAAAAAAGAPGQGNAAEGATDPSQQGGAQGDASAMGATSSASTAETAMIQEQVAPEEQTSTLYTNLPPPPGSPTTPGRPNDNKGTFVGLQVERPVRVELRADRIVVGGSANPSPMTRAAEKTVMLGDDPQKTSEAFTQAIKEHVASWGTPGRDSAWKPVLVLYPEPGREALANELTEALRASGIEVRLPETARR